MYKRCRKRLRIPWHSYCGWVYFVTINVKYWLRVLSEIKEWEVVLNSNWEFIEECWNMIPSIYSWVSVSDFVVMPSHIHGIIWIDDSIIKWFNGGTITNRPYTYIKNNKWFQYWLLSKIIKWFKQASCKKIRKSGYSWFQWHRSYYDSIIRDEIHLNRVKKYIANNPLKWELKKNI
jgi:REP element-mobilizing transposase RayT